MKVSKQDMAEVFELRVRGTSWENLGVIYNVSPSTLRRYYKLVEREGYLAWDKAMKCDDSDTLLQIFDALSGFCFAHSDIGVIVNSNTDSKFEWGEVREARRKIKELINFAYSHGIKEDML
jgi:DNA-binding transcriptional regulator YhcF (GntR family)